MLRNSDRLISAFRLLRVASGVRRYSSSYYVEQEAEQLQQELLETAVKHIKQHGWSRACLVQAAKDLQLSPAAASMFPRGASELVEHVIRQNNAQLAAELQASHQQFMALPLPQRIAAAVKRRLEMNASYMNSWPQALAILAQPRNSPEALRLLLQLLDDIWYAAGDKSTDSSWYTKRASLAAIYTSTELYMLTDYSPGYSDTWQQLERRVQDALWLGSAAASVAALPQQLLTAVLQAASSTYRGSSSSTVTHSDAASGGAASAAAGGSGTSASNASDAAVGSGLRTSVSGSGFAAVDSSIDGGSTGASSAGSTAAVDVDASALPLEHTTNLSTSHCSPQSA